MGLTLFRVWVFVGYLDSEHFDTFAHFQFSTGFYCVTNTGSFGIPGEKGLTLTLRHCVHLASKLDV